MSLLIGPRRVLLRSPPAAAVSTTPAWVADQGVSNGNASTASIVTVADIETTQDLIIGIWHGSARTVSSTSDGLGNTYTTVSTYTGAAPASTSDKLRLIHCRPATRIPSGTTVTITLSGAALFNMLGQSFSGLAASSSFDLSGAGAAATSTTPTIGSPGTPATATGLEISITASPSADDPASDLITPGSGFTNVYHSARATRGVLAISSRPFTNTTATGHTEEITKAGTPTSRTWLTNAATWKGV